MTTPASTPTPSAAGPAWSDHDLRADPHAAADKADRVRTMFGSIAGRYDLNNRVHSLWRDQAWRRHAVRVAAVRPGERVLDVACGTGDLTAMFARRTNADRVIGADFTPEMLEVARHKQARLPADVRTRVDYTQADAMDLPFPDNAFGVVSIAFGIRNVQEPAKALAEFARVLKPGGRLVILEFDTPRFAPARLLNNLYCRRIMPVTATAIAGDRSGAYKYLPKSVGAFANAGELAEAVQGAGFEDLRQDTLTFGICVCTVATRPAS